MEAKPPHSEGRAKRAPVRFGGHGVEKYLCETAIKAAPVRFCEHEEVILFYMREG